MQIFGILNVTPDSFSDGGSYINVEQAKIQASQMISQGASVIDVGGESTRPGAEFVDAQVEIERVIPVIEMLNTSFEIEISIDTYKSEVAEAAIKAGATIINDVQINQYDGLMLDLVAKYNVKYVGMHSRKADCVLADIVSNFEQLNNNAKDLGIDCSKIILDPGIGFNKDLEQNLLVLKNLKSIRDKFPTNQFLLGTSRKRFIGAINNLPNAQERVIGTAVTTVLALQADYQYVRVHDVLANKQAIEIVEAVNNCE